MAPLIALIVGAKECFENAYLRRQSWPVAKVGKVTTLLGYVSRSQSDDVFVGREDFHLFIDALKLPNDGEFDIPPVGKHFKACKARVEFVR